MTACSVMHHHKASRYSIFTQYLYCHQPANALLECRDLGPPRPQHPCSCPWGFAGALLALGHQTQGAIPHFRLPLLALSLPAASRARVLDLARLWAVLEGRERFSKRRLLYIHDIWLQVYISLSIAVRSWEHVQRLKACTSPLGRPISLILQQCRLSRKS